MDLKQVARVLSKNIPIDCINGCVRYWFVPIDHKKVEVYNNKLTSDCPIQIGDQVLCHAAKKTAVRTITDAEQKNYLPRFNVGSGDWIGKTKIYGKVGKQEMLDKDVRQAFKHLHGQHVVMYTDPEVLDFTNPAQDGCLVIEGPSLRIRLPLQGKKSLLDMIVYLCQHIAETDGVVMGWNLKSFFSYHRYHAEKDLEFSTTPWDLKLLESFMGIKGACPGSFKETQGRLAKLATNPFWGKLCEIYQKIHVPLMTKVIPAMETLPLTNKSDKQKLYAHYEIEGQAFGRLKATSVFKHSYKPHSMSLEEKEQIVYGVDDLFLGLDYKNMEVAVLQWLSGDEVLLQILESGMDVYAAIWETLTGVDCDQSKRQKTKMMFLPVVFGMGAEALAKRLETNLDVAKTFIERIYNRFPTALEWVQEQQESLDENYSISDYFGRCRTFEEKSHRVRNFVIQAPSAMICLYKLVKLYQQIGNLARLAMSIHDGYVLVSGKKDAHEAGKVAREILESEEDLFPGLRLRVDCKEGASLGAIT